ncbi:hypothetical protein KC335_g2149 [Hortaea werneckii]|nr:hypothetical protein KC335_g2149 [Hortaea werneckii]
MNNHYHHHHHPAPDTRPRSAGKMRGNTRQRPASHHGPSTHAQSPIAPARKIFNCIVDDTALVAGVKRSTRNGIRQWVKNGQIRLFVPLHALEQLGKQKGMTNRHGEDVRETLQWLDDATNKYPNAVTLQGGDQYYENWNEVERFAVPRTLFSENDHMPEPEPEQETNGLPEQAGKLNLEDKPQKASGSSAASAGSGSASPSSMQSERSSLSPVSPPTSPTKDLSSPAKPTSKSAPETTTSSSASVPQRLQPLLNYILWRIHQELNPAAALESFIFLCNDPNKVQYARGFDIRSKRLEQLRDVIGREDRDWRNRQSMLNRENQQQTSPTATNATEDAEEDDDEVVYKPPVPRGPAAVTQQQSQRSQANVMDPNEFGRNTQPAHQETQPTTPRANHAQPQQARGGHSSNGNRGNQRNGMRGSPRGRGTPLNGRGGFAPGSRVPAAMQPGVQPNGEIDPESFARPRGSGYTGRGGRKLWVPT